MPKTLTASQSTARDLTAHVVSRVLLLKLDSGWLYIGERGQTVFDPDPSRTILPWLVRVPVSDRRANIAPEDLGGSGETAIAEIAIDPTTNHSIAEIIQSEVVNGRIAEAYEVYKPATGGVTFADWIRTGLFAIDRPTTNNARGTVSLSLVDRMQQIAAELSGRIATTDLVSTMPDRSVGKVLPRIFGSIEDSPGVLVTGGARSTLAADIGPYDGTIALVDASDFAATGLLLIGDEAVQYTAKSGNTIGTAASPVVRGWVTIPQRHSEGTVVLRRVPTADKYRWVLGDQAGASAGNVKILGLVQDGSNFAVSTQTIDGESALVVDVDELPANFVDTGRVRTHVQHELREVREISDATNADPIVITCPNGHNFSGGNAIFIDGVEGNTAANGRRKVKASSPAPTATTFAITDMDDATVAGIAAYTQGGSVHPQVLQFTDFTGSPANNVADWENTVDLSSEKLQTFVDMTPGDRLSLTPAVDLISIFQDNPDHPYLGRLIGARAFVEFQAIIGPTGGTWPVANTPILEVVWSGITSAGHILDTPQDLGEDLDLFLTGDPTSDSTDMFTLHTAGAGGGEGTLETERTYTLLFKEIDTTVSTATHGTTGADITFAYWGGYSALSNGYPIWSLWNDAIITSLISVVVGGGFGLDPDDGTIVHGKLVFRPANDGSIPANAHVTKMVARIWVIANTAVNALPQVTINVNGGAAIGISASTPADNTSYTLVTASVTGEFDKTDILATDIEIQGESLDLTGIGAPASDETKKWEFWVTKVELVSWDLPVFEGESIPLTGHASAHTRFSHDITEQVLDRGAWASFLSSGTGQVRLSLAYPAQSNDMVLRVYRIGFEVDVADQDVDLITEDEAELTADVIGYGDASNTAQETIEEIITGDRFMALTTSDYDQSGLVAAIGDLTTSPWELARHINTRDTFRELLATAVRDSGIRFAVEAGRIVFFPKIGNAAGDSIRTIARSVMPPPAPDLISGHVDLVANRASVFHTQSFVSDTDEPFAGSEVANDAFSQALGLGIRNVDIFSPWLRDATQAAELASRTVADFRHIRDALPVPTYLGRTFDLELGDVVTLEDDLIDLNSATGRIIAGSRPGDTVHRLVVALADDAQTVEGSGGDRIDVGLRPPRMEIYIGGTLVAVLVFSGLWIAGELTEKTNTVGLNQSGPVFFDGGSSEWRFGVHTIGIGANIVAIDASGNLRLEFSYQLQEQAQYPVADTAASHFEADGTTLDWSPDLLRRFARIDSSTTRFIVRHLRESAL